MPCAGRSDVAGCYIYSMDAFVVFVARYLIILSPLILLHVIWMLPQKERVRFVFLTIFSLGLAYLFAKAGSQLYDNPRPFMIGEFEPLIPHGVENGFPSIHTLFATTVALIALTKHRLLGATLLVVAIAVGVARVFGDVHHVIDIVGGFGIALVAVIVARLLLNIRVR